MNIFGKKLKTLANVLPKVDVLGPDIKHVPKKIQINNPLPDLKNITPKVDNELFNNLWTIAIHLAMARFV